MSWKASTFFTFCFCFMFWSVLAVHYSHMKGPSQYREVASFTPEVKPWYDASWKM